MLGLFILLASGPLGLAGSWEKSRMEMEDGFFLIGSYCTYNPISGPLGALDVSKVTPVTDLKMMILMMEKSHMQTEHGFVLIGSNYP